MEKKHTKEHFLLGVISLLIGGIILVQVLSNGGDRASRAEIELPPEFESFFGEFVNQQQLADLLVQAVVQIESAGNPNAVGGHGERGLMQIMPGTWKETTQKMFGKPVSFDEAFDPVLNKRVGRTYLGLIQSSLVRSKKRWKSDERSLLLAGYNAGPAAVRRSGYDVAKINSSTRQYVQKVIHLHDQMLEENGHLNEKVWVEQGSTLIPGDS